MDHFHASAKIYTKRLTTCKDEKHLFIKTKIQLTS